MGKCTSESGKANERLAKYRYNKTVEGHIKRLYGNALRRTLGKGTNRPHAYKGLPICTRDELRAFALADNNFHILYLTWKNSGWDRRLTPSLNRIDTSKGYTLDNIEFLSMSENVSIAQLSTTRIRDKKGRYA